MLIKGLGLARKTLKKCFLQGVHYPLVLGTREYRLARLLLFSTLLNYRCSVKRCQFIECLRLRSLHLGGDLTEVESQLFWSQIFNNFSTLLRGLSFSLAVRIGLIVWRERHVFAGISARVV